MIFLFTSAILLIIVSVVSGYAGVYLLGIGLVSACLFAYDKHAAIHNRWRVSEKTLLLSAFLGGAPFSLIAMFLFRHKTSKPGIFIPVILFAVLQLTGLFFWYFYGMGEHLDGL